MSLPDWSSLLAAAPLRDLDDPRVRWIALVARALDSLDEGDAGALVDVLGALDVELAHADLPPGSLSGAAGALVGEAPRAATGERQRLWGALAVLLSAHEGRSPEGTRDVREAAAVLARAATEASAGAGNAAIAVRLARLSAELGDPQGAARAWRRAIERDVRVAWALGAERRRTPAFAEQAGLVVLASSDIERAFRQTIELLASPKTRLQGRALLDQLVGSAVAPPAAKLIQASELLGDAARAPATSPRRRDLVEAARALLASLDDDAPATLLAVIADVLSGLREEAVARLAGSLARVSGRPVEPTGVAAMVDAVTELIRRPPYDPRAILEAACFDALFDPLLALTVPRGPLAAYRAKLLGLSLAVLMASLGSSATAFAGAPTTAAAIPDVAAALPTAPTEAHDEGAFSDADDLRATSSLSDADLTATMSSMLRADLSGSEAHAHDVERTFAAAHGSDLQRLRFALADALVDSHLVEWIAQSPERHARAEAITRAVAPPDPSIAENEASSRAVDAFTDWAHYAYAVIVVTGYTPSDLAAPTPGVHGIARARLEAAAAAYAAGRAPFILVSGGAVYPRDTPYFEGIEMKKALVAMGIPADAVIVDARARHTTTNLRNAGRYMLDHGMKSALIVAIGGGVGGSRVFDQAFYLANPEMSTFHGRCERELGYRVGDLAAADGGFASFSPSPRVRELNFRDPLDP